jgi:hypothetical protein
MSWEIAATFDRMEKDVSSVASEASLASIAVSLRRIADALDRITTTAGVMTMARDLKPFLEALDKE